MRLHISRIPALYLYLSAFPSQSSSFPSLAITTTANRSSLSTLTMSSSSSLPASASASAGTTSASKNNVGLSDIGNGNENGNGNSSITSWRDKIETSIAKSRKIRGGNYVQIATVDHTTLEPRCRTVVFRGFLKPDPNKAKAKAIATASQSQPCIMKMITDKRSNKFQEVTMPASNLTSNPQQKGTCSSRNSAEMVWWFSKSSEQYRIRGQLKFVGADETEPYLLQSRKEQWGNLSDMAREQFYWEDPGLTYSTSSTEKENAGDSGGDGGDGGDGHGEGTIPAGGRDEHGKVLPAPDNFLLMLLYPTRCDYLRLTDNFRQVEEMNGHGHQRGSTHERTIQKIDLIHKER
mmetsp:Transcript_11551/g.17483  ORF Transcript_11551/g.17483 Transcript_11551/m.17483 type:complete len:349 (-) Transcript_11551:322-1368(-)